MDTLQELALSLFSKPVNLFTWDALARGSLWDWYGLGPEHVEGVATAPRAFESLAVLSAHPSGYVRERALLALAKHGSRALPWLLLRTVDWVPVVSAHARRAVLALLVDAEIDAFIETLPLALRTRDFSRAGASVMIEIGAFLARQPDMTWMGVLGHSDAAVRRAGLTLLAEKGRATPALLRVALVDKDLTVRTRAARLVTAEPSSEMGALREMLLNDREGPLRLHVLRVAATADIEHVRHRLELALTDRMRAMRELARHHLGEGLDQRGFAAFYRTKLREIPAELGAIQGLAETGSADDWELLLPSLDANSLRACAALKGMATLNRGESRETRLMMVDDPRKRVSQVAANTMMRDVWETDAPILRAYLASPHLHVRMRAIQLVTALPGWAPPLLLLSLDEPALQPTLHLQLARWLTKHRATIAPPTRDERARLEPLLTRPDMLPSLHDFVGSLTT